VALSLPESRVGKCMGSMVAENPAPPLLTVF
jgi:hypothetical protein